MQIIHDCRRSGKTEKLIRLASEGGGYIVCFNKQEAFRISEVAKKLNIPLLFPLTYSEYLRGEFWGERIKGFYIDNVDFLLSFISKDVPVNAITITKDGK